MQRLCMTIYAPTHTHTHTYIHTCICMHYFYLIPVSLYLHICRCCFVTELMTHWARQQPATECKNHMPWTTIHSNFLVKIFSYFTNINTHTHTLSYTKACSMSHQTNIHWGKVHCSVSLQARQLISCSAAAHWTACKSTGKCHLGPVRCCSGP